MNARRRMRVDSVTILAIVCALACVWCLADRSYGWAGISALSAFAWVFIGRS